MSDKARAERRRAQRHATIEVVCPGMLEVLSVGKGDIKLTVGGDDPDEVEKARRIIEEMLEKGYGIFVETDEGLTRVRRFNAKRMTYVISDTPPALPAAAEQRALPPGRKRHRRAEKEVPVGGTRATAIGRTSGG